MRVCNCYFIISNVLLKFCTTLYDNKLNKKKKKKTLIFIGFLKRVHVSNNLPSLIK